MGNPNKIQLKPYLIENPDLPFSLLVCVEKNESILSLEYHLTGDLNSVIFPERSKNKKRAHGLWEHTCFEAFLSIEGQLAYWELNLSPSGDWNFYSFTNYRRDQKEEVKVECIHSEVIRATSREWTQRTSIDLSLISNGPFILGLSAVILEAPEEKGGNARKTYWAICHCGHQPDFHQRDSFKLTL